MNILHLTDLHFSNEIPLEGTEQRWDSILASIKNSHAITPFDVVAVTGDFTCHGDPQEFALCSHYLERLLQLLSLTKEEIHFCPGNHDADETKAHSSFHHYEDFLSQFYGKESSQPAFSAEKDNLPYFQFLSANTCHETSLIFHSQAVLPDSVLTEVRSLPAKSFGILLMHHQPAVIENQDLFRQITRERNLRLILSGHLHPTNTMFYKVDSCAVITGMAITPQYDWIPSGFQIIHISTRGKVVVKPVLL